MISTAPLAKGPTPPRLVTVVAFLSLAVLLCGPASAGRAPRMKHHPSTPSKIATAAVQRTTAAPIAPGMVIAVDPETGALGLPSPEQMLELTAQERTGLLRTSAGLTEVRLPDGAVMVDLQGRFMEYTVLRIDPLGHLRFSDVDEERALIEALTRPVPAPAPIWEDR